MKRYKWLVICVIFLGACSGDREIDGGGSLPALDETNVGKAALSDFFSDYEFVFLETSKESLMGGHVQKLIVLEDRLLMMDRSALGERRVMSFDRNTGRFLGQIGKTGNGPGEYSFLVDFCVDKTDKTVHLYCGNKNAVLVYGLDGSFMLDKKQGDQFFPTEIALKDSTYVMMNNPTPALNYYSLNISKGDLTIVGQKLSLPSQRLGSGGMMSGHGDRLLLWMPNDTIYDVTGREAIPEYVVRMDSDEKEAYEKINLHPTWDEKLEASFQLFDEGLISDRMFFIEGTSYCNR